MVNERSTEEIVRQHLKDHPSAGQTVEEQTSANPLIRRALAAASKSGTGLGKPEFIVTFEESPRLVLVVECKADITKHESAKLDKPAGYAVDGVLRYAEHLSSTFDVIAVAVSGTAADDLRVSTFRRLRGAAKHEPLTSPHGQVDLLVPVDEYRRLLTYDPAVRARTEHELLTFSRELHNYMRDYAGLSEAEKPLVVSGILLSLQDPAFRTSWAEYSPKNLASGLLVALKRVAEDGGMLESRLRVMLAPYQFLDTHPELNRPRDGVTPLHRLIDDIDTHVRPFIDQYHDVDVIGQFYGEFLRYSGGDKKGLGIVLTPRHLTELAVRLADVTAADTVVDIAAGTGGFLIAAMQRMDELVGADTAAKETLRRHQLVGVEQQPHMFALAVSNMILRGDGKSNLYQGSCFDPKISDMLRSGAKDPDGELLHERPTVGLINPPFSQKGKGLHELDFVERLLDDLAPGGRAVVIVPISCAVESHPAKARILKKHTLVGSMSLPNDLFHSVGTITCALVFRAGAPHSAAAQGTWFGYWKDDGFVKTKNRGRVDLHHEWPDIRDEWLEAFHERQIASGKSLVHRVTADDEWCVEAYMETDYAALTEDTFQDTLRRYAVYKLLLGSEGDSEAG